MEHTETTKNKARLVSLYIETLGLKTCVGKREREMNESDVRWWMAIVLCWSPNSLQINSSHSFVATCSLRKSEDGSLRSASLGDADSLTRLNKLILACERTEPANSSIDGSCPQTCAINTGTASPWKSNTVLYVTSKDFSKAVSHILHVLLEKGLLIRSPKHPNPECFRGYDPSKSCDYQTRELRHETGNCSALKNLIQNLITTRGSLGEAWSNVEHWFFD